MDDGNAKPWLQTSSAGVIAAVDKLKRENTLDLFLLLTRTAAGGEWDIFLPAFERVSEIKGIKLLLAAPDGFPMRYAYENARLPPDFWPVFIGVLESVRTVLAEAGGALPHGKPLRDAVLQRVFALPEVRAIPHAAELAQFLAG